VTKQTITVLVKGDTASEVDETFFVNLSAPVNATIATGKGTGTITNDDGPAAQKSAAARNAAIAQFAGRAELASTFDPLGRKKDSEGATDTILATP
jgi:hypothetical protein